MPIPFDDDSAPWDGKAGHGHAAFCRLAAAQEVELMELRELRDDPESTAEAINLLQRIRHGEAK